MTFEEYLASYNEDERRDCPCGKRLINDFKEAYFTEGCGYYEVNGEVITTCGGESTKEYVTEDLVFYRKKYYKKICKEANVGDLILINKPTRSGRQVYKVRDFGGYETRTVKVAKGIDAMAHSEYMLLVPVCEEVLE
jgi:hypothetical protein